MKRMILAALATILALPVAAEMASYGRVELNGLARESWPYNPAGLSNAMVCNVNGPDGWLAVRSGPGADFTAERKLKRLAIVEVDTRQRRGHWVRVVTAYRTHSPDGQPQEMRALPVSGWAHDGYLCDFLD